MAKELLLRNARCWTGVVSRPWADAAIIRDGRVAFAGRESEISTPAGAEVLDCGGRLIVPGFTDGHAHLLNTGMAMRSVDLKDVPSLDEAISRVAAAVSGAAPGSWIRGAGWDQHVWADTGFPTRQHLDGVAPDTRVMLIHTSGHCIWVNSAALQAAGVTRDSEPPAGGEIGRDEYGELSGLLFDNAVQLVYAAMPPLSRTERVAAVQQAMRRAHSLGVTGVHAMDVSGGELSALQTLQEEGELRVRAHAFLSAARLNDWLGNVRTGDGDDMLRIGGVKFFSDGALGSLTAWMDEPYERSANVGFPLVEPDELEHQVRACLSGGLAPAIHAIGDRANRAVLDILERTRSLAPELPRRIEHAQLLLREDTARFGKLGITASVQPIHATQDMAKVDSCWGDRGRYAYAFATLLATGANLAFGSDSPVETMDPLVGVHAAVMRRNAHGEPEGGWYPEERVPMGVAVAAYGGGCARAVGEASSSFGCIAEGYHADLAVLSEDIFTLDDPMLILDTRVDMTVVAGEVVYQRDGAW